MRSIEYTVAELELGERAALALEVESMRLRVRKHLERMRNNSSAMAEESVY